MIIRNRVYYETVHPSGDNPEDGIDYKGFVIDHNTLEDAIEYAEPLGIDTITEIGGSWTEYKKCWFCGEWFDVNELNTNNECSRCEASIKDHFDYK